MIWIEREYPDSVRTIQLSVRITGLYGGSCLGIDCNHEFFAFYDWDTGKLVRRIDAQVEVREQIQSDV